MSAQLTQLRASHDELTRLRIENARLLAENERLIDAALANLDLLKRLCEPAGTP